MKRIYLVLFFAFSWSLGAQEVLISKDINVREDLKYVLLGKVGEHILLFRDINSKKSIEIFDENLKFKYARDLNMEKDKKRIYHVFPQKENFNILYGLPKRDSFEIRQRVMDSAGDLVDSIRLATFSRKEISERYKYSVSDDKKRLLLFNKVKRNEFHFIMINLELNEMVWQEKVNLLSEASGVQFQDILISNNEDIFILFERSNNRYDKKNHQFELYHIYENIGDAVPNIIPFTKYLSKDTHLTIDEKNQNVLIIGLYTEANRSASFGYFFNLIPIDKIEDENNLTLKPFTLSFINDLYGNSKRAINSLDYYFIKDVVFDEDGGFVWIGEMFKEYFRRTSNPYMRDSRNYGDSRGYVDFYNEDMVIFGLDNTGNELWSKVLNKKQFSQDDDAMYSSYFLMKTPSRLRLLFNDEIKRNNTVSEYLVDPMGNSHRKTVLNTEYENLRLQFTESIQVGSNEVIVPSLSANILNLVKIQF